jgi:hypothetical protein
MTSSALKCNGCYSKRAGPRQREWLMNYYRQTGFDALYQEDFDAGKVGFPELRRLNCKWYEDHSIEVLHNVERA